MSEITGALHLLILLVVLCYLSVCSGWDTDASRLFLRPVYYEKSCSDGMVAYQDYFILKGIINITNVENGQSGTFSIRFIDRRMNFNDWIGETIFWLKGATCRDVNHVRIDSCACTFMDTKHVRLMCNLTAKTAYSQTQMFLRFANKGIFTYSPGFQTPRVYGTPVCIGPSVNRAAKSHLGSFSAVLGTALLGTAVVCQVSSTISQI
ncbi:unnamed protein product [Lymnaea stagnalis]|uniref:Uncharacterized protein n=1 Tax=Lymnaea stagnalis TaxID=6523 RepID=A0AAV2H5U9_LYMST